MPSPLPEYLTEPGFAVSVRGYERAQVDDYVARVLEWLVDAESRATVAQGANEDLIREVAQLRRTVGSLKERSTLRGLGSMATFGDRLGGAMQAAVDAAEELQADAQREARGRLESAGEERERIVGRARDEAERIMGEAGARERGIAANITNLLAQRQSVVEDIARLHGRLGELVESPEFTSRALAVSGNASDDRVAGAPVAEAPDDLDALAAWAFDAPAESGPTASAADEPTAVQPAVHIAETRPSEWTRTGSRTGAL